MRAQSATQENTTAALVPPIQPRMPWRVVTVEPLSGFRLKVCFVDGTTGEINLSTLIQSPDAGVFAVLSDEKIFSKVYVEHGAVTWPGEIDLAPDAMYRTIKNQDKQ